MDGIRKVWKRTRCTFVPFSSDLECRLESQELEYPFSPPSNDFRGHVQWLLPAPKLGLGIVYLATPLGLAFCGTFPQDCSCTTSYHDKVMTLVQIRILA